MCPVQRPALPAPQPRVSHGCLAPRSEREFIKHDGHMFETLPVSPC